MRCAFSEHFSSEVRFLSQRKYASCIPELCVFTHTQKENARESLPAHGHSHGGSAGSSRPARPERRHGVAVGTVDPFSCFDGGA